MIKIKKLLNFRPVLFSAVSLCCGISVCVFILTQRFLGAVLFGVGFIISLLLYLIFFREQKEKKKNFIFSTIFLSFFILGGAVAGITCINYQNATLDNHQYQFSGKVIFSEQTDYGRYLIVDKLQVKGIRNGKVKLDLELYVYGNNNIDVGDEISFIATPTDKGLTFEGKINGYSVSDRIKYTAEIYSSEVTVIGRKLNLFEKINLFFRESLKSGLDYDEFSVGYALLTGGSEHMDEQMLSQYRLAGVAHIFAVSGLHVGFLALVLNFIFNKMRLNSYIKAIIITLILLFYSGVCGFSASSIRATVMTSVGLFATAIGQRYDGLSSMGLSAIIILLASPMQLFCAGFQLSFGVVIGINLLSRPISDGLKFLPQKISSAVGVVVSAQLFAIPISLASFNSFSPIAVIINLIFVPVVTVIYVMTFVCALMGGILELSHIFLLPSNYVFKFINLMITALDWKVLLISGGSLGVFTLFYYGSIISISGLINFKKLTKIIVSISLAIVCVLGSVLTTVNQKEVVKLNVVGDKKFCISVIDTPTKNIMVVNDADYVYSSTKLKRLKQKENIEWLDLVVFTDGFALDIPNFLNKLYTAFEFEHVVYFGEQDTVMEGVIKRTFHTVKFTPVESDGVVVANGVEMEFALKGCAVTFNQVGKTLAFFSPLEKIGVSFTHFEKDCDYVISAYAGDALLLYLKPQNAISYRADSKFTNGEKEGNLTLEIG